MMEWNLGFWIPIIIGCSIGILVTIVIIYIFLLNIRNTIKKDQTTRQKLRTDKPKFNYFMHHENPLDKAIFCYNCGYKLEGNQSKYCPRCGTKI